MQTKPFAETGINVAAIGQGTTGMGTKHLHSKEYIQQRINTLRLGIDLGMTFVDTASLYGNGFSEEVVGKALIGIRDKCFLATKFYPHEDMSSQDISMALEGSLRRLQTHWVDLYQIHWPNPRVHFEKVFEDKVKRKDLYVGEKRWLPSSNYYFNISDRFRLELPKSFFLALAVYPY